MAVFDYFLKITDIKGESTDSKHPDEIVVESFSWGLSQSGTALAGAGGSTGKSSFQDFSFVAPVSLASPKLFLACASGQHIKEATLTVRKAGKTQQEFLIIKMSDLVVSGYETNVQTSETPDGVPTEQIADQISLNFAKLDVEYKRVKEDGSLDAPLRAGWNIDKGSAF